MCSSTFDWFRNSEFVHWFEYFYLSYWHRDRVKSRLYIILNEDKFEDYVEWSEFCCMNRNDIKNDRVTAYLLSSTVKGTFNLPKYSTFQKIQFKWSPLSVIKQYVNNNQFHLFMDSIYKMKCWFITLTITGVWILMTL